MQTVKQEVSDLLSRLPDDCTLEDVQYHLYVLQKIERGLKDVEEGQVYTQEEVEKKMSNWISYLENRDSFLKELKDKYCLTKSKKSARTSDNRAQTVNT